MKTELDCFKKNTSLLELMVWIGRGIHNQNQLRVKTQCSKIMQLAHSFMMLKYQDLQM